MDENNYKANYLLTIFTSFSARIFSIILTLFAIPIALNYFGNERFAIWSIFNNILVYLSLTNLGLPQAASILIAKNNRLGDKWIIFKRVFLLIFVTIIFFLTLFYIFFQYFPNIIFILGTISAMYQSETKQAFFYIIFFFLINNIFSLVDSAFTGFQKIYIYKFLEIFWVILSFLSLILTFLMGGDLVTYILLLGFSRILITLIKSLFFYFLIVKKQKLQILAFNSKNNDIKYRTLIITAIRFFILSSALLIIWNTDNLVISHFLGLKYVTPYAVTFRGFLVIYSFILILNSSVFPILAKEYSDGNWRWINKIYRRFLSFISVIGGGAWIFGILFFRDFIQLWTGSVGYAGLWVVVFLGGYAYFLGIVDLNSGMINNFNYLKHTVWIRWVEALLNLTISILFLKIIGIAGVAFGTFIASLLIPMIFLPLVLNRKSKGKMPIYFNSIFMHLLIGVFPFVILAILQQQLVLFYLRLITAVVIMFLYISLNYVFFPKDERRYFIRNLMMIWRRFIFFVYVPK